MDIIVYMEKKKSAEKMKENKGKGLLKKAERLQSEKAQINKKPFFTKFFVRILVAIILVLGFYYAIRYSVRKITQVSFDGKMALVEKQLSYCQELVTVKSRYSDIVTLKKSAGFAKSYSIIKFSGILRCGIADITDVFYDISKDGKTITLTIPPVELLGNEVYSQEVFDEKQSIFVPITTQEIFDEIDGAKRQYAEEAIADGILKEAEVYAEKIIRQMMMACGFESVEIK